MSHAAAPTDDLEIIRLFANTVDVEENSDRLATVEEFKRWCREVLGGPAGADPDRLAALRVLRDEVREALSRNARQEPLGARQTEAFSTALEWARPGVAFGPRGVSLVVPEPVDERTVAARVVAAISETLREESFTRVKLCRNDACGWAFYDGSRSRTGRWCSMEVCGNRVKQAKWRQKRS